MALPLLQTKLFAPSLRPKLVHRDHLLDRLNGEIRRPLTLISAPAGFGKTTVVRAWIAQTEYAVAWLSLDADDNDLSRFLAYLVAALRTRQMELGETALTLLSAPQSPPAKVILTLLLNELSTLTTPLALVLDDYHLISAQPIHEAVTFLIDHLPPLIHLLITTRIDPPLPLHLWRARNQLAEIRADDLRFLPDEAAAFLNEVMALRLTDLQIATLEARTEGWIAGLQLAALSLQGRDDVAGFIQAFSGSHRHVLTYLIEEVLLRCPEGALDFLLQTSILDRLSAPLCNAVTGRNDSHQLLAQIEQANLFLIPLDDNATWYRYHHLFAEVLRSRLQHALPDLTPTLHRRASEWYQQHGQLAQAINHTLEAKEWARAARLLKPIVKQMVECVALAGQAQTVLRWLKALPDAEVRTHPTLCFYHATVLMFTGQLEASEVWLNDAEQTVQPNMPPDEARTILGWVAVIRADIARVRGDLARAGALAQQAQALLPDTEALASAVAHMNVAHAYLSDGNVTQSAERIAEEAIAPLRAIGNLFATNIAITNLARLQALQGRCRQAAATFAQAEQIAPEGTRLQDLLNGAAFYIGLGDLLRERNELEAAHRHLTQGMALVHGELSVDADVVATGYVALAKLKHALGDLHGGLILLDEFILFARERGYFAPLIARGVAAQAQLWLASGADYLAAAVQWAGTSGLTPDDNELSYLRETEHLTLARVLIAQQQAGDALRLLARMLPKAEGGGRIGRVVEILMLQAMALQEQDMPTESCTAFHRALILAEPEGYIRIFVDEGEAVHRLLVQYAIGNAQLSSALRIYVDKVLSAFDRDKAKIGVAEQALKIPTPGSEYHTLVEPLSEREMEVLQLVAAGLSNSQIAARLIVTTGTIKTHVNHIFGKLGVQSRTQAAARARSLGLLSD